jgi:glyoxylase-like metal-dependent hydrolase (beta-lactamase superfamily II)
MNTQILRLRRAAFGAALVGGLSTCAGAAPLAVTKIADGAYAFFGAQQDASADNGGAVANLGFVVGQRCVAVIDTGGTPAEGQDLRQAVRAVTPLPVCAVINTHMHPDHVYGNAAFAAGIAAEEGAAGKAQQASTVGSADGAAGRGPGSIGADFIGHVHLAAALAARRETYARAQLRALGAAAGNTDLVAPTVTVAPGQPYTLDLGGRRLQVRAWPTAHTDNDVTVFDEASATLWAGDLLFVERTPVLDGSVNGWLAALDQIEGLNPPQVVPGHGPLGDWKAALSAERRYLQVLRADTRAAIKAHRSLREAAGGIGLSEKGRWLLFDEYHQRNVAAAYAELEWEE